MILILDCLVEEQTDNGGDGWIDMTRGCAQIDYDDEDDTESSTYFRNQSAQGQKRKKAPFFKYSKKRKGYGNTSGNSKGFVVFLSHVLSSSWGSHLAVIFFVFCFFPPFLLSSCGGAAVGSVVATAAINRGHHLAPEVDQKLQAGGPGAQREMHQQAGGRASWLSRPLKPTSDPS